MSAVALIKDPNAFDSARNAAGILQSRFGDFRSVWLLLTLLVLVLLTAVVQLAVRRALTLRFHLAADEEVYEIAEYFIQWFTIFLVVYQLYFAEIKEVFEAYLSRSLTNMAFDIALTPENLNIVMQPIAFSSSFRLMTSPLFSTTSIILIAMTTGIPSSFSCVER